MRQPIRLTGCRDVLANMMLLHTCAAALCRRLYIRPGMGIGHFKHAFGGRIRTRGCKPEHHGLASSECNCARADITAHLEHACILNRGLPVTG
eukprot:365011-Chlamydomonas_euryale.AAC.23